MYFRRIKILGCLLLSGAMLTGCGFSPLYGEHGTASSPDVVDAFATVSIRNIPNREGMKLRQQLRQQMQPHGVSKVAFDLDIVLARRIEELGIRSDATSSRANLIFTAVFALNEGGQRIYGDRVEAFVSYNILDDQYATVASQADAENRGIKQVSEEIKTRLAVYFHNRLKKNEVVATGK
jgi:LPS-assembly lipoprotein